MAPPDEDPYNPYEPQTLHNTRTDWLDDQKPLDVDLDGLTDYAANMETLSENLRDLQGSLKLLATVPNQAWDTAVLSEMGYMRHRFQGNYAELAQYLGKLQVALMNIGMAAQTIADAYRETDGLSAASVDAVRFAFGDHRVDPPSGLPAGIDYQTYFQHLANQQQTPGQEASDQPDALWSDPVNTEENGVTTYTSTNQFGHTRVMTQELVPGRGYVYTTTVTDKHGNVISRSQQTSYSATPSSYIQISGTRTTTTVGDQQFTSSTSTSRFSRPEGGYTETTTNYQNGNETGAIIHDVDAQGNQVVTTTRPDDKGEDEVIRELHIGANTDGVTNPNESPANDALRSLGN